MSQNPTGESTLERIAKERNSLAEKLATATAALEAIDQHNNDARDCACICVWGCLNVVRSIAAGSLAAIRGGERTDA